jgi:hypothetical protein
MVPPPISPLDVTTNDGGCGIQVFGLAKKLRIPDPVPGIIGETK